MTDNKTMKILIRKDGQMFKEIDFSQEEIILGRSKEADIQLLNEDVSRKHTRIFRKGTKIFIQDMGSKNGTIFNGQTIEKIQISPGDTFFVGPFNISVEDMMPSEQRTIVEYNFKSEAETREFEPSGRTNTRNSMKIPVKEAEVEEESEPEEDSDSFLDAIAVGPDSSVPSFSVTSNEALEDEVSEQIKQSKMSSYPKTEPVAPRKQTTKSQLEDEASGTEILLEDDEDSLSSFESEDEDVFEEQNLPETNEAKTIAELDSSTFDQKPAKSKKKPAVEKPESATELRKDFPSASENNEPSSEQFFLNREIDESGVSETYENFPDTNKIKPSDSFESSFTLATEGEVQSKARISTDSIKTASTDPTMIDSDAIATDEFQVQTVVSPPDEDHIKTFMFAEKNLPASLLSEATDEYTVKPQPKWKQILFALKPKAQAWLQKPGSRKIMFVVSAIVLGLGILFAMEGGSLFHREPVNPELAINSEAGFQKLRKSEKKRVILFQIDQIQKLINERQVNEADERMRKLMILASKDEDFVKFEKSYQDQREAILIEENKKKQELEDRQRKKEQLLTEAQEMIDDKQFDLAKKNYMHALDLFPDDPDVQDKIQTLELMQEQDERQAFAKKQRYEMLNKIYTEGVQKYESGQPGVAQKLFKQVTAEKGHPKYKKAVEYLSKIENMTDKKIDQKIAKARQLLQSQDTLIQGYQELKKISSQFPLRADAKKYFTEAKTKMDKRARELYADALAQEELAGDPAAALDLYKEVLKYAPDSNNKYNQKAREKIESLQL